MKKVKIISCCISLIVLVLLLFILLNNIFSNEAQFSKNHLGNSNKYSVKYHTRHIPEEHLNMDTPMGKGVKENGLCDVLRGFWKLEKHLISEKE